MEKAIIEKFKNGYINILDLIKFYNNDLEKVMERLKWYGIDLLNCDLELIKQYEEERK